MWIPCGADQWGRLHGLAACAAEGRQGVGLKAASHDPDTCLCGADSDGLARGTLVEDRSYQHRSLGETCTGMIAGQVARSGGINADREPRRFREGMPAAVTATRKRH